MADRTRARDAFARVSPPASRAVSQPVPVPASENVSTPARRKSRRVGRPRGPARVALTVRILAVTDGRLTAAVHATGQSPQYIVDEALDKHLTSLGL